MHTILQNYFELSPTQSHGVLEFEIKQQKAIDSRAALDPSVGELYVSLAITGGGSAIRYYLAGDRDNAIQLARMSLSNTERWLAFDWAKHKKTDLGTIDPNWMYEKSSWMRMFRLCTMWACVLGDWRMLDVLCKFPSDRIGMDTIDATPARRQMLIDTARLIRGEDIAGCKVKAEDLKGFNKHGVKQSYEVLDALRTRKAAAVQSAIQSIFSTHKKRKRDNDITNTISVDGTLYVYFARHRGLDVAIDEAYWPYLVDLERYTA